MGTVSRRSLQRSRQEMGSHEPGLQKWDQKQEGKFRTKRQTCGIWNHCSLWTREVRESGLTTGELILRRMRISRRRGKLVGRDI